MELRFSPIEDSPFSYDDVVNLMHSSFEEHLAEGLHFTCSTMDSVQFKEKTKNGIVLVTWDKEKQSLLGTATVTLKKDCREIVYGYYEYLAVSPSAKRLGLGTKLLDESISIIKDAGGQYVMSDTAIGAISSVKWHKKNGFKIIGLTSYLSTNYYSYLFRKQLTPSSPWNNPVFCWFHYMKSSINTRLRRKADGTPTFISNIIKRMIHK